MYTGLAIYHICLFIENHGWETIAEIRGTGAAWDFYFEYEDIANLMDRKCCLVDGETAEVLADNFTDLDE